MNRLVKYREKPPEQVIIDGEEYIIDGDFANCLLTIEALCSEELSEYERAGLLYKNMYNKPRPENYAEAVKFAFNYLRQFKEDTEKDKQDNCDPDLLDFEQDGQYIYDAFLTIGINLDKAKMTWLEFNSRLRELPKECFLCRIIYLRQLIYGKEKKINKKEYKSEREEIKRIGEDIIYLKRDDNFYSDEETEKWLEEQFTPNN